MQKIFSLIPLAVLIIASIFLYKNSLTQSAYLGLPAVPCIDNTLPLVENYSFSLKITINGQNFPLSPDIGHDPGSCLRSIYTNSSVGVVWVQSNVLQNYTLGDFFNTWRQEFDSEHLMNYWVSAGHSLTVKVNGVPVSTYEDTLLAPNEEIEIIYQ